METSEWTQLPNNNYVCVDCEEEVTKEEVYGDPRWSDPRCLDCYESHRYDRN